MFLSVQRFQIQASNWLDHEVPVRPKKSKRVSISYYTKFYHRLSPKTYDEVQK